MATEEKTTRTMSDWQKGWLVAVAVVIALFVAFMVGIAAGRWPNYHGMYSNHFGGMMMREGTHQWDPSSTSWQNRFIGTVTAVNGPSFTLAGGGSTITVQTNSSTQWHGGDSVKANDTAAAFGTINGGTLTATEVAVNP